MNFNRQMLLAALGLVAVHAAAIEPLLEDSNIVGATPIYLADDINHATAIYEYPNDIEWRQWVEPEATPLFGRGDDEIATVQNDQHDTISATQLLQSDAYPKDVDVKLTTLDQSNDNTELDIESQPDVMVLSSHTAKSAHDATHTMAHTAEATHDAADAVTHTTKSAHDATGSMTHSAKASHNEADAVTHTTKSTHEKHVPSSTSEPELKSTSEDDITSAPVIVSAESSHKPNTSREATPSAAASAKSKEDDDENESISNATPATTALLTISTAEVASDSIAPLNTPRAAALSELTPEVKANDGGSNTAAIVSGILGGLALLGVAAAVVVRLHPMPAGDAAEPFLNGANENPSFVAAGTEGNNPMYSRPV